MTKEVIGTNPSTGEVLVRDTETDVWSWEPGTEEQVASATEDIIAAGDYGTVDYQEYVEPEPEYVPPPPPPVEEQVTHVAPTTLEELAVLPEEEIAAPTVSVGFMGRIVEGLNDVSSWFYQVYLEVLGWVYPLWKAADAFYWLSSVFSSLAWDFYYLSEWVYDVANKVVSILSWSTIWSYILIYIPNLEQIRDWFYYWWTWVDQRVTDWWSSTSSDVLGWIDAAKDWTKTWIDWLDGRVSSLQVVWDNFITVTLPTLPNWFDIDDLIKSWFANFSPLWEGWQELKSGVTEFISDPEQWFYDRLEEIFERYW